MKIKRFLNTRIGNLQLNVEGAENIKLLEKSRTLSPLGKTNENLSRTNMTLLAQLRHTI